MSQERRLLNGLIDPPSPYDTLETWERHLAEVLRLPDTDPLKTQLISEAEEIIRSKRIAE
jgi:hypothetical protein